MVVRKQIGIWALVGLLSACSGESPFLVVNEENTTTTTTDTPTDTTDTNTGVTTDETPNTETNDDGSTDEFVFTGGRTPPPGTNDPTPGSGIQRLEPTAPDDEVRFGDGFAKGFIYNSADDTFVVNNLAFDGDNAYTRDDVVDTIATFAVYENSSTFDDTFPDPDVPIDQFVHKILFKSDVTDAGDAVSVALVRTGSYRGYGFGGWAYQREGDVVLPTTGQAQYTGKYAGLRDFNGQSGLQYAEGDMAVAIDFFDFENSPAITGRVFNRRFYDLAGNDVTADVTSYLTTEANRAGDPILEVPDIVFLVTSNSLSPNGEILGDVVSSFTDATGQTVDWEQGTYYGLLAGNNAERLVGVLVVESQDFSRPGTTNRETGGFILARNP